MNDFEILRLSWKRMLTEIEKYKIEIYFNRRNIDAEDITCTWIGREGKHLNRIVAFAEEDPCKNWQSLLFQDVLMCCITTLSFIPVIDWLKDILLTTSPSKRIKCWLKKNAKHEKNVSEVL